MYHVGFIGMGNMGTAILKGLLKTYRPEQLAFTQPTEAKGKKTEAETGVKYVASNAALAENSEILVLAVKPQFYNSVLPEIGEVLAKDAIVISLAPGVTIDTIHEKLGQKGRIVRCMPNTPAMIGEGMTGVSYDESQFSEEEKKNIRDIFESFGEMELVPEHLMDVVTCLSGSSPAYVYMFIEALADAGVKHGMPRAAAYKFAAKAVAGSAEMVLKTGKHPAELKDNVCSPGGTTIAGVAALEEYGLRNAVIKASDACYDVCTAMKSKK
ncbi:MAG: pyrroline-5-carboxylate reductase [Bacillota bacterium]|nr:pyrroline-5-carboxylate reductase [Bacillota bacterium]